MEARARSVLLYVGAAALLAVITWIDYVTGYELGLFVLYFAPVALVAWYGRRSAGLWFAVAAGACWYFSDLLNHHPYPTPLLIYWETFMRTASFVAIAAALGRIRSDLARREELLDVISHDLRSPLSVLVGQAQLLRRRLGHDAFVAARVDAILRCTSRMDHMIEDLLDSARKRSHRLEPVRVGQYLPELIERCAPVMDVARIRLEQREDAALVARADPSRLDRIVVNLVANALKYSPPESVVEVGATRADRWVEIRVADHGPGIAPADLPHLFERFYRSRRTAARDGLGLGLFSARLLVEEQGGTLRAEATPAGGATFVVALPAAEEGGAGAPRPIRGEAPGR
jgi:signal transduction histidine kinase